MGSARPSRMRGAVGGVGALAAALLGAGLAQAFRPALRIYGVSDGLKSSQVFCVVEDREGMSGTGTSHGVSRYDGRTFESLTSRDGLPHDSVSALAVTGDGSVWAATKEGLARIAPVAGSQGEPRVVPPPPSDIAIAGVIDARGRPVGGRPEAYGSASITVALGSPTFFSEERALFSERLLPLETDFPPPRSEAMGRRPGSRGSSRRDLGEPTPKPKPSI